MPMTFIAHLNFPEAVILITSVLHTSSPTVHAIALYRVAHCDYKNDGKLRSHDIASM
jgi:hypothetical protein